MQSFAAGLLPQLVYRVPWYFTAGTLFARAWILIMSFTTYSPALVTQ